MSLPVNRIVVGDCVEVLKSFPDGSVDLMVTDPPYGLEFMGKSWDKAVPSIEIWKECLRILKDGAFAFIMCIPRLDCLSQMAINLKSAGFEIGFTPLFHAFASGFPKAENIAKNIRKQVDKSISDEIWRRANSNNASIAEALLRKLKTEAGIPTDKNDSVTQNALENTTESKSSYLANIVEKSFKDLHPKNEDTVIALVNAELWRKQSKSTVPTVENPSENPTVSSKNITFVPVTVPISLCEKTTRLIKDAEVQKTWLGKTQSSNVTDTIVKCAELIDVWKHTILSQLVSDPTFGLKFPTEELCAIDVIITKSITDNLILNTDDIPEEVKVLDGSYGGFQPKPAVEVIIVCMKPLSEKTFADQALRNGKGCTRLDDARIPFEENPSGVYGTSNKTCTPTFNASVDQHDFKSNPHERGRFPANLLVSDDVLNDGEITTSEGGIHSGRLGTREQVGQYGYDRIEINRPTDEGSFSRYFDLDKWFSKQIENLPESVRKTFPFLICPKASKSERNQGCESLEAKMKDPENRNVEDNGGLQDRIHGKVLKKNFHPTVKPLKLMSYLVTLGSRKDDVVVDPFVGSGTTCLAAEMLGRKWVGIEVNMEYAEISVARMNNLLRESGKPLIEAEVIVPEAGKTMIEAKYSNAPKGNCGHAGKCGYRDENGNCGYTKYCHERIGK